MNVDLFRAEWLKIAGNRWATAFFIWIWPVGMFIISVIALIAVSLSDTFREAQLQTGVAPWNESLLIPWAIVNNIVGRWVIIAFTAFVFAGEYKHGTWKNLITRRQRVTLILNKFFTVSVFVTVAFILFSLINGIGSGLLAAALDIDYGLSNAGDIMGQFLRDYFLQASITLTSVLIGASFAAFAAMLTKNIMASVLVGIFFYMLEYIGFFGLVVLAGLIFDVNLVGVYQFLPSYNLDNIVFWINEGRGISIEREAASTLAAFSVAQSMLIIAIWAAGLVSITAWTFQRQDITT